MLLSLLFIQINDPLLKLRNDLEMKFSDFVAPIAIQALLASHSKESVIGELVDALIASGKIASHLFPQRVCWA
jgi:hypothetical protein